ncbi:hypothetical protein RclHR1_04600006 [Rhizophagus clarus]|uniref:Reverse transcriptase zinc-binding domain-containing protein n=1 Tax=Rhizophagus clarus TaxID=94130 RepID=A0A2Z6RIH9_9GLOM|nr:hypothetical protein RclHR1_04600006 [Rhizophagus clarus]
MRVISKTNMGRVQACSEWRDLRINKDTFVQRSTQYQWEVTWTAIQQVKHFRCTSFKRNSLWSFIIKILHQQLPVGRWLRKRKPSLYRNFNCQFCNRKADETILHLITCPDTVLLRQLIYEALWAFLADTLPQFSESLSSASLVASEINGWIGISAQSTRFKDLLIGAVAGKMDSAQFTYIQGRFKWSHHHTVLFCAKLLIRLIWLFKSTIWLPQCERTIKWEKHNGISKKDKMSSPPACKARR